MVKLSFFGKLQAGKENEERFSWLDFYAPTFTEGFFSIFEVFHRLLSI